MLRIIMLDWRGTLDTVADPVAFVDALKAQGDVPILFTSSPASAFKACPGLRQRMHGISKLCGTSEIIEYIELTVLPEAGCGGGAGSLRVVFVDDDEGFGEGEVELMWRRRPGWYSSFVPSDRIDTLLPK